MGIRKVSVLCVYMTYACVGCINLKFITNLNITPSLNKATSIPLMINAYHKQGRLSTTGITETTIKYSCWNSINDVPLMPYQIDFG